MFLYISLKCVQSISYIVYLLPLFLLVQIWASYVLLVVLSAWLLLCMCESDMFKQRKIKLCI